jgi:DNA polymerase III delta prime subunit
MNEEFLWTEKYRPKTVSECILPDRLKKVFQQYVDQGEIPNLMLSGTAGVGKTTVARAMCLEIGLDHLFINSSEDRGIDMLRTKIRGYASTVSLTGGRKVIILDEADGLTPDAQDALRGAIEAYSVNCTFILTCNFKAKLKDAIHSRCSVIDFTLQAAEKPQMATQFYKRIAEIMTKENVAFDKRPLSALVMKYFPDYRRCLNELQRLTKETGKIDDNTLHQLQEIRGMDDLVKALKDKNYSDMQKWVVRNSDLDPARIFRKLYDSLRSFLAATSIPPAVLILAKYQYQAAFVADQEINLVACLTEIMVDCELQ